MGGIYAIENTSNGKLYVGSALNFTKRWREHRGALKRGDHHSRVLQRAWEKYGEHSFKFSPLLVCSAQNLLMYEQRCIDSFNPEYNACAIAGPMSQLGRKRSDESKDKMRASWHSNGLTPKRLAHLTALAEKSRGKPGRKHSDETRALLATLGTGKKQTAESNAKRSATQMGRQHSAESIAKMSASKLGKKRAPFSDEWKAKLGAASRGHTLSAESRAKVSRALVAAHARRKAAKENS